MKRCLFFCIVLSLGTMAQQVLLVHGVSDGKIPQSELNLYSRRVSGRLSASGIRFRTVDDDKLGVKSLEGITVAVFPHNCSLRSGVKEAVDAFVAKGGTLVVFFSSDKSLLGHLGIQEVKYIDGKDLADVSALRFEQSPVAGTPKTLVQRSRCMLEPTPLETTLTFAQWEDSQGKVLPRIAATYNANGFYFSHVYLDHDADNATRFWASVLGKFAPQVWHDAVEAILERIPKQDGLESIDQIVERVRRADNADANAKVTEMRTHYDAARRMFLSRDYPTALSEAEAALKLSRESVLMTFPSRESELRGAWIHSAYGIKGWTWDETIRVLSENGFNAIFPNMSWACVADYKSDVLPVHPDVNTLGDQIEACLAACRKYGVELHVWHVCWNMGHRTPPEIVKWMQDEKRTQISLTGASSRFLAPHIEENFNMEKEALLEIVRKYDVDGIHLDYIRYPDSKCDFSPNARAAFEKTLGNAVEKWPEDCRPGGRHYAAYNLWRQNNISRLVEVVSKEAHAAKPSIKVSAAVYGEWEGACEWVAQDAVLWVRKGWLDFICPMNYSANSADFRDWLSRQLEITAPLLPIYAGIGAYMTASPVDVAEQIRVARTIGADGFVCFSLTEGFAKRTLPMLKLSSTAMDGSKLMPHNSRHVGFEIKSGEKVLDGKLREGGTFMAEVTFPPDVKLNNISFATERNGVIEDCDVQTKMTSKGAICQFRTELHGFWRLVVKDKRESILARSPAVQVLDREEVAEWMLRKGPPKFAMDGGIRVAVWQENAYGAETILKELNSMDGVDAAPLFNLDSANWRRIQVLIIPQPRKNVKLFKDATLAERLASFVKHGGGLMTTHSMIGARGFVN
ncbi:MAG: family 10 glycosylhydrolase, partial [Victivallales bacterium]|nr:family 10 glycosylhydrolase [Victivallales bacterium]